MLSAMKNLVLASCMIVTVGCASLPVPTETSATGVLAIPVIAKNEAISRTSFSYSYMLRMVNQQTEKKHSFNVIPKNGTHVMLIDDLDAGEYCIDGYYSKPIVKEGHRYTFSAEYQPYESCFMIKANGLTVWQNKVAVLKYTDEKNNRSTWQRHNFVPVDASERADIEASLNKYKNIELWQPIFWASGSNTI